MVKFKYVGDGNYISGIPARDITDFDIAGTVDIQVLMDSPLYEAHEEYICVRCDKKFKTWNAYNKHELKHISDDDVITSEEQS